MYIYPSFQGLCGQSRLETDLQDRGYHFPARPTTAPAPAGVSEFGETEALPRAQ